MKHRKSYRSSARSIANVSYGDRRMPVWYYITKATEIMARIACSIPMAIISFFLIAKLAMKSLNAALGGLIIYISIVSTCSLTSVVAAKIADRKHEKERQEQYKYNMAHYEQWDKGTMVRTKSFDYSWLINR